MVIRMLLIYVVLFTILLQIFDESDVDDDSKISNPEFENIVLDCPKMITKAPPPPPEGKLFSLLQT